MGELICVVVMETDHQFKCKDWIFRIVVVADIHNLIRLICIGDNEAGFQREFPTLQFRAGAREAVFRAVGIKSCQ